MSSSTPRVVLTGFGLATSLGIGKEPLWEGLVQGKSGIRPISAIDVGSLETRIAGEIVGLEPKNYIEKKERKSLRVMARTIQLAVVAAQLAVDDAKMVKDQIDPTRFGLEFGAGLIPSELHELGVAAQMSVKEPDKVDLGIWGKEGIPNITPLWMLKYLPNMLACHVSILQNAQGPNNTITESDVAGLLALGEAFRIIRRKQADIFLVGGADSKINPLSLTRQAIFGQMTKQNDPPETACKPFDADRDGYVIGEGSGIVILEELEHAKKRNAHIYGEVVGVGSAFDRGCTGAGLARTIRIALNQAGIKADDVDFVSANGLGSIVADRWEAKGISEVFGDKTPAWSIKGQIGTIGSGSGLIELAAGALALEHGTLPATKNFNKPDPECPVLVLNKNRPTQKPYFVKVGFTDMGQCAAIVCKKWEA